MVLCQCVCLSVRLSVTRHYCIQTPEGIVKQTPDFSPRSLVFLPIKILVKIQRALPSACAPNTREMGKFQSLKELRNLFLNFGNRSYIKTGSFG